MDRAYVTAWYALIALVLLMEAYALLDGKSATPPLTQVLVREVPWWVTVPFLVWALVHLASRYLGRPIL
jgi:hypothetical protein